ncbi:hypothetical protein PRIPAC_94208 [Pristionchus pacificus]|uniref:Zinc finger protein n=1 Tax=Pristionchus pacificus TaxID=54126 RepID=A0A454Y3G2_PRIPA|nr:hypothetical protein PRIPAC_94208 [Pristionchus pacificus]|eukprot:PDM62973.1 zinc finger protein [Pristionchus pacificus]
MPAMTATTRRPRTAASAALSRIQKSAIDKAAPKPKKEKKEKETCTICMNDLSQTRQTKIACGHKFHRTCILNWLEKQLRSSDQACPNCRAPYGFIMNGRKKDNTIAAYGDHQQPTLWYIHRLVQARVQSDKRGMTKPIYKTHLELALRTELEKTMKLIRQLQAERAHFYANGYAPARQFVYDIDDEITKLADRKKIYKEMEILAGSIGKRLLPNRSPEVPWHLKAELREACGLSKPVREPTPIDSSDSSEYEIVEEEDESESDSDSGIPIFNGMRIHAPRIHSRRRYIIINDSDDEDDQENTSVAMRTGGRVPRHLLETREATSSQ